MGFAKRSGVVGEAILERWRESWERRGNIQRARVGERESGRAERERGGGFAQSFHPASLLSSPSCSLHTGNQQYSHSETASLNTSCSKTQG